MSPATIWRSRISGGSRRFDEPPRGVRGVRARRGGIRVLPDRTLVRNGAVLLVLPLCVPLLGRPFPRMPGGDDAPSPGGRSLGLRDPAVPSGRSAHDAGHAPALPAGPRGSFYSLSLGPTRRASAPGRSATISGPPLLS